MVDQNCKICKGAIINWSNFYLFSLQVYFGAHQCDVNFTKRLVLPCWETKMLQSVGTNPRKSQNKLHISRPLEANTFRNPDIQQNYKDIFDILTFSIIFHKKTQHFLRIGHQLWGPECGKGHCVGGTENGSNTVAPNRSIAKQTVPLPQKKTWKFKIRWLFVQSGSSSRQFPCLFVLTFCEILAPCLSFKFGHDTPLQIWMSTQISNVLKADMAELVRVQKLRRWGLSIHESIIDFPP